MIVVFISTKMSMRFNFAILITMGMKCGFFLRRLRLGRLLLLLHRIFMLLSDTVSMLGLRVFHLTIWTVVVVISSTFMCMCFDVTMLILVKMGKLPLRQNLVMIPVMKFISI